MNGKTFIAPNQVWVADLDGNGLKDVVVARAKPDGGYDFFESLNQDPALGPA